MAKTSKKTTKTNIKNKHYLKKSARWTIAGLMLATAIIIALIPVTIVAQPFLSNLTAPVFKSIR